MSSARMSFGAILSTVQATANTVTATVDAANKSVGMLTAFIDKAAVEQRLRHLADAESFADNLIAERAQQSAEESIRADKFCDRSEAHSKYYNDAHARFTSLLKPKAE